MNVPSKVGFWKKMIIFFLLGFVALSSFVNDVIIQYTSVSVMEVCFLPVLYIYRNQIMQNWRELVKNDGFYLIIAGAALLALGMLGIVVEGGNVRGVLGSIRGYLYIAVLSLYFRRFRLPSLYVLLALAMGALFGDLLLMLKGTFGGALFKSGHDFIYKTNLMALYIAVTCAVLKRNIVLLLLVAVLTVGITIIGAFRINIAVMLVALLGALCVVLKGKSISSIISLLLGLTVAGISGVFTFSQLLKSGILPKWGIFRIVDRTNAFFEGDLDASQDDIRFNSWKLLYTNESDYLLPQGMIVKNEGGGYNDLPLHELFIVFSMPVAIGILFFVLYKSLAFCRNWLTGQVYGSDLAVLGFSVLVILFMFLNGRFLYIPAESILFGLFFGRMIASRRTKT
ncbi:MAG: hypothetical protein ACSHW7_15555 [Patiriisocius sp.]|uniref:hypothetical protein n=1 Tax=Patiriisocius sp. TaxID=2822396 RepID=UPI003EF91615